MTIQDNPAQNNPAPEHALFGFPVYPLFCAGDPNNVAMGTTPEMVCPSVADTIKMWKLLLDPGHMIFDPAGLNAQQHIWHLIHGFATNHYSEAATARGIHLASQMLQLESLSYNKETAVKLYAQGCLISADTTDLENSNVPCIGWFTVTAGSSDIGFKLNPEYTKDVDAIIPWTSLNSLNRAALIRIQPGALNFTLYEQNYGNQGLPQSESESGLGSDPNPGPFKFTGIEHLFPVDRLDVPLVPRDQATTIGIAISGSTGQINNWHFKQQGDRLNKSDRSEHAPCMLHIGFNDISQCVEETKIIDCSFMRTSYVNNWFEKISTSKMSMTDATITYEGCLFAGVELKPRTNSMIIGTKPNPKLALNFNECSFLEASVDIRSCSMPGISLINCFGTQVVPSTRHNSLQLALNPDQVATVVGATNKDDNIGVGDFHRKKTSLSFWVGPDIIGVGGFHQKKTSLSFWAGPDTRAGGALPRDFGTDEGAKYAAEITLMDMPRQNPVRIAIDGPAKVFMSDVPVSAIRRCPRSDNHFVGVNVKEPREGIDFMEWNSGPSKTSVELFYSNIDKSVMLLSQATLNLYKVATTTWERARAVGVLQASLTENNVGETARAVNKLLGHQTNKAASTLKNKP